MAADADAFLVELKTALLTFDKAGAGEICDRLIEALDAGRVKFDAERAKRLLGDLRKRRYFELMERTADAFVRAGVRSLNVERQLGQALLDQGRLLEAMVLLTDLARRAGDDPVEGPEVTGLLGRAFKQASVSVASVTPEGGQRIAAKPAEIALRQAVETYHRVYSAAPEVHLWHGINVVACAARAERDGVTLAAAVDWQTTAEEILAEISQREAEAPLPAWDLATAIEACVARERVVEALDWAEKYVSSYDTDAFAIASTLRQLTDVWQLDSRGSPAAGLLPILRGALLRRDGGAVELGTPDLRSGLEATKELQAKFGAESARSARWFKKAFRRTQSVARVMRSGDVHVGTAFLVRGSDLLRDWGRRPVLVTNAHVLAEPPPSHGVGRREARVRFTENKAVEETSFRIDEILFSSPPDALDATIATLREEIEDVPELQLGYSNDIEPDADPRPRLSVIGHPSGRALEISLYDNHLVDLDPPYVYYRSLTEGGSSGSPVFDQDWDVVALHHAANRKRQANEGVAIDAIREELEQGG